MKKASLTALVAAIFAFGAAPLAAQVPFGDSLSTAGIYRASASVDSVFVDRSLAESTIDGGDFASYLMARLGVIPIPPDLGFRVAVDSQRIMLNGRVSDLPAEAREELGMMLSMVPDRTPVLAYIDLLSAGPRAVRFRLSAVALGGMDIPEVLLQTVMSQVGRRYPTLTKSGRDLFVEIPVNGRISLVQGGVRLVGPERSASANH
jgi:hypothetical protein